MADPNITEMTSDGKALDDSSINVNGILPGSGGGGVDTGTDQKLYFGDNNEWSLRYDSSGAWIIRDETADQDVQIFGDGESAIEYAREIGSSTTPVPGTSHFEATCIEQQNIGPTTVTASDSPYATQGESRIAVDSSTGTVTVTLASADAVDGRQLKIVDSGLSAGSNTMTVEVEGANGEVINPGGQSSITVTLNGGYVELENIGGDWFTDRNRQSQSVSSKEASIGNIVGKLEWDSTQSDQTISDSVVTKVGFATTKIEDSDVVTVSTTDNTITVDKSGKYLVGGYVLWSGGTDWTNGDRVFIYAYVNGGADSHVETPKVGGNNQSSALPVTPLNLSSGDTIDLRVEQRSGVDQTLLRSPTQSPRFGKFYVGRMG